MRYIKIIMLLTSFLFLDNSIYGKIYTDFINQGKTYINELDIDRAIYSFSKAIDQNQNAVEAYLHRAKAYLMINEFDKSSADYEKAMKLDPEYVKQTLNIRINTGKDNPSGFDSED